MSINYKPKCSKRGGDYTCTISNNGVFNQFLNHTDGWPLTTSVSLCCWEYEQLPRAEQHPMRYSHHKHLMTTVPEERSEMVKNTKPCFHRADTVHRYKEEIKAQLPGLSDSKAYTACFNCIMSHWRDTPSPKNPHLTMQSWYHCLQQLRLSLCRQSSVPFLLNCSSPTPKSKDCMVKS